MGVTPIRTQPVTAGTISLTQFLDQNLEQIPEGSLVAIASKVVSLCEGRVAPPGVSKDQLISRESERHLPPSGSYRYRFTITHGILIPAAGIDESNVGGG